MADGFDSSWDVLLTASLDTTQATKELNDWANKYKHANQKYIEVQAKINLTNDKEVEAQLNRSAKRYQTIMNNARKKITETITQNPKKYLNDTFYSAYEDNIKEELQKMQKDVQQSEIEQQRIIQQSVNQKLKINKEYYNQMAKLQKSLQQTNLSDTDKKNLTSQFNSLKGTVGSNTAYINANGSAEAQAQNKAYAQVYQTSKLIEQSQENQRRNAQEIKNAYNDLLTIIRQINSNNKEISQLESKNHLNSQEKERLTNLKHQTGELQEQYNQKMKIVSQDSNLQKKAQQYTNELEQQNKEINKQNSGLQTTGKHSKSLMETVKNIGRYVLMYQALNAIQTGVQKAYETISELDKAFTDIQLVTGDTDEEINQLSQDYNELAKQMGATTQEVAEGASEWLRQGKSIEETNYLLKSSMTLSKVGAMESAEATQLLTSTLNGYKFSAEEAMNVVDKVSAIDMAAATSSEELMTALSRTANSADDAGISFDKLLAMIGTVSSVTRKSASTIGESFKTIFSRMSNVAAGKEIDDEGESLNDVETSLNKMGIALRSSQNEWRNFEDVLDEVAGKWSSFTGTQQSQIATAIAGRIKLPCARTRLKNVA